MPKPGESCESCQFFLLEGHKVVPVVVGVCGINMEEIRVSVCRRHAPSLHDGFPLTRRDYWCGDYQSTNQEGVA